MKALLPKGILFIFIGWAIFFLTACRDNPVVTGFRIPVTTTEAPVVSPPRIDPPWYHHIRIDVPIRRYFEHLNNVIAQYDSLLPYQLTEHLLVRANAWIIDTLEATDYYRLMAKDNFVYDPRSLIVLHRGDSLLIPDSLMADSLRRVMTATVIDINVPEFKLRILEAGRERYAFPIRVGQNRARYLAMADRLVDLRTQTGTGYIYRINRHPVFVNPVDNQPYTSTKRDDGRRTLLPGIPWIEPIIDGQLYGQLIHPTTNPETLGKAYSNGCIGMAEADMWRLYYHAPLGTRIVIRYDLEVVGPAGDTIRLRDIYPGRRRPLAFWAAGPADCCPCSLISFPISVLRTSDGPF